MWVFKIRFHRSPSQILQETKRFASVKNSSTFSALMRIPSDIWWNFNIIVFAKHGFDSVFKHENLHNKFNGISEIFKSNWIMFLLCDRKAISINQLKFIENLSRYRRPLKARKAVFKTCWSVYCTRYTIIRKIIRNQQFVIRITCYTKMPLLYELYGESFFSLFASIFP